VCRGCTGTPDDFGAWPTMVVTGIKPAESSPAEDWRIENTSVGVGSLDRVGRAVGTGRQRQGAFLLLACLLLGACSSSSTKPDKPDQKVNLSVASEAGREAYASGEWRAAEPHYLALVRGIPQDAANWFRLGNIYARTARPDPAVAAYREAAIRDPSNAKVWFNMGLVQLRQAANSFINMNLNVDENHPMAIQGEQAYAQIMAIIGSDATSAQTSVDATSVPPQTASKFASGPEPNAQEQISNVDNTDNRRPEAEPPSLPDTVVETALESDPANGKQHDEAANQSPSPANLMADDGDTASSAESDGQTTPQINAVHDPGSDHASAPAPYVDPVVAPAHEH
jgi:tetratricopeptide (TPR) repeat protein